MTAAAIDAEPLAVWDVRGAEGPWQRMTPPGEPFRRSYEATQWVVSNFERARDVFRIEFYVLDAPFAIVHRYCRDENGHGYYDPEPDSRAAELPVVQMLDELPPAHLLGR
jgi:hypothetical protein